MRCCFGATEQKILDDWIVALLQLGGSAVEIDSAFVQISNAIAHLHRALHVVRHHDAGYLKARLQSTDEMIDAVGYYRVQP